jgi:hypothetical protein
MQRKPLSKESYLPNTFPRVRVDIMGNKNLVVRSNIQQPSLGRNSTEFVLIAPSHSNGIQQIEE